MQSDPCWKKYIEMDNSMDLSYKNMYRKKSKSREKVYLHVKNIVCIPCLLLPHAELQIDVVYLM